MPNRPGQVGPVQRPARPAERRLVQMAPIGRAQVDRDEQLPFVGHEHEHHTSDGPHRGSCPDGLGPPRRPCRPLPHGAGRRRDVDPGDGQVVLRVDRVGHDRQQRHLRGLRRRHAVLGLLPGRAAGRRAYGRVPLWGFATVEKSAGRGVAEGTRLFGYLPTSSHLVVEPAGVDAKGFRDASAHRQHLPTPYNGLTTTTADPAYDADQEDLQVLYRPLFMTSFVLADFIEDNACFGADTVVISSASSKTSYGTAFLLDGVHRIGLTSERNRAFTESLGCYDEVVTYGEIADLPPSTPCSSTWPVTRRSAVRCTSGSSPSTRRSSAHRTTTPSRTSVARATCPGARPRSSSRPTRCASATPTGARRRGGTPRRGLGPVRAGGGRLGRHRRRRGSRGAPGRLARDARR